MDKQIKVAGDWALAADSLQWILQRRHPRRAGSTWDGVSFVRTTKAILARCMREKGVPDDIAALLLDGSPDSFDAWHGTECLAAELPEAIAVAKASVPSS